MRYYELTITGDGGDYVLDANGLGITQGTGPLASSLFTQSTAGGNEQLVGQVNPNALNIEFDLPITMMHNLQGAGWVRLYGIGLRALGQAANLNPVNGKFKTFVLKGGMSKGFPLVDPSQAGIIAQGNVFQAFGNWSGTNQTLDLIVQPGPVPPDDGSGIMWQWKKGQSIGDAISQTLSQAMPGYTPKINVSENLVAAYDQPGHYPNFASWANSVRLSTRPLGQHLFGKNYQGVQMAIAGKTINVSDGKGPSATDAITLRFEDLVGQPTWISPTEIIFPMVMRGDIDIQKKIKFPSGIMPPFALTSPDAAYPNTPASSSVAFQGEFVVNDIHHYANFRQEDAASWNTTFRALVQTLAPAAV